MVGDLPWFEEVGRGERVLVLLHAFPLSSAMWQRAVPLLAPHARVVCVDLPGLGRTPAPELDPSMGGMARGVLAVLDHLDVGSATLWGVSTGGYAALELARTAPERIEGLVLSSTTPWLGAPDPPAERREVAATLLERADTEPVADSVTGGLGTTAQREQPDLVDLVAALVAAADPAGVAWAARAVASRVDTSSVLAGLPRPVLLLFGEEDTEVPAGTVGRMSDLRGSRPTRVEVLAATGHLLSLEQPRRSTRAVLDWLDEVGG